jgi:hypothetical protein
MTAGLVRAAQQCESTGEARLAHCFVTIKKGDLMLASCAARVDDTTAACATTAKLAVNGSLHLKPSRVRAPHRGRNRRIAWRIPVSKPAATTVLSHHACLLLRRAGRSRPATTACPAGSTLTCWYCTTTCWRPRIFTF